MSIRLATSLAVLAAAVGGPALAADWGEDWSPEEVYRGAYSTEPKDWTAPIQVPRRKARFARLIHVLAGPLTEFDAYFKEAGMVEVEAPWP